MAKRKTAARKTRQAAAQSTTNDARPYRGSSKHVSASPSVVSSPSPQPQDLVQRRRKGTPVRSPAQNDQTKGIVFAFRIKNDSDLSMAVDILSYDQIPEDGLPAADSEALADKTVPVAESEPKTSAEEATALLSPTSDFQNDSDAPKAESASPPASIKVAGENWSSDPSAYLTNNVVDLSRNVLILHSRKPQDPPTSSSSSASSFHPYRRPSVPSRSSSLSQPSTPPSLTDSQSSSSASSSPSTSPNSPTMLYTPTGKASAANDKDDVYALDALSSPPALSSMAPLGLAGSPPSRILSVRGLGAGQRKMKVYLV
ncbi:hypothetical protein BGZ68_007905 [Mortierella alpina]|nr:hypothetical protein BGZ68_007905 [Mortierella alpina]